MLRNNQSTDTQDSKIIRQSKNHKSKSSKPFSRYECYNIIILAGIFLATVIYAGFAAAQWWVLNKSMKLDERAWIGFGTITAKIDWGKPIYVTVSFKNTGKTPAKNVKTYGTGEAIEPDAIPDFARDERVGLLTSPAVVTPEQEFGSTGNVPSDLQGWTSETIDIYIKDIMSSEKRFYIHGIVKYDDIFRKHHWLTFCYYYLPDEKIFKTYKEHNDTDDN